MASTYSLTWCPILIGRSSSTHWIRCVGMGNYDLKDSNTEIDLEETS